MAFCTVCSSFMCGKLGTPFWHSFLVDDLFIRRWLTVDQLTVPLSLFIIHDAGYQRIVFSSLPSNTCQSTSTEYCICISLSYKIYWAFPVQIASYIMKTNYLFLTVCLRSIEVGLEHMASGSSPLDRQVFQKSLWELGGSIKLTSCGLVTGGFTHIAILPAICIYLIFIIQVLSLRIKQHIFILLFQKLF